MAKSKWSVVRGCSPGSTALVGLQAGSATRSADSTKCICLSSGSLVKQDSKAHRKRSSLPQRTKSTLALILKTLTTLLTTQVNMDSPLDAASGSGTGSSEGGSAGGAVACLASSISSSSGMTSFIRLWLHTFATSLMSEWRQCKEHAVPGMRGAAGGQERRSHCSPSPSAPQIHTARASSGSRQGSRLPPGEAQVQGYSSCGHRRRGRAGQQSGSPRSRAASPGQPAG